MDHAIHHLTHAETMAEIMERVAAVIFLNAQLRTYKKNRKAVKLENSVEITILAPFHLYNYTNFLTSQRLRVIGFMLNSFTRPKSWYMYSRQLSI